jgi:hypothetical protein
MKVKPVRTLGPVPNKPKTQHRSVRVADEDWADLETAAAALGTDRAKVINQFIRWYLRRAGAKLPEQAATKGHDGD